MIDWMYPRARFSVKDTSNQLGQKQNGIFFSQYPHITNAVRKMGGVCNTSRIAPNSHAAFDELSSNPLLFRDIGAQGLLYYTHKGMTCNRRADMCRLARGNLGEPKIKSIPTMSGRIFRKLSACLFGYHWNMDFILGIYWAMLDGMRSEGNESCVYFSSALIGINRRGFIPS